MATGTGSGRGQIHYGDERETLKGLLPDDRERHYPDNFPTAWDRAEIPELAEIEEERAA
jgi:hypothetical protein